MAWYEHADGDLPQHVKLMTRMYVFRPLNQSGTFPSYPWY